MSVGVGGHLFAWVWVCECEWTGLVTCGYGSVKWVNVWVKWGWWGCILVESVGVGACMG